MTTATPIAGDTTKFADLGLAPLLVDALTEQGIISPFPIQELTLGLALQGADIIGQARTGTGKTLGFGLPMLQRLDRSTDTGVQVLVIVPTRELCVQVAEDLEKAGSKKGVGVLAVYGGKALDPQIEALRTGDVEVVVGTPGRLLDLMRRGDLDLSNVRGLVLDEADEMLDLGFLPDVEQLIEQTSTPRQTLLFSATMPSAVVALARRYMEKPTFLRADVEEVHIGPKTVQHFFSCHRMDKPAVLARILQDPSRGLCLVFSRTKRMCDILAEELQERGVKAAPIHSDLRQEAREKALTRFREGKIDVLVATEVAARGLDIDDVTHVVNYDCPDDEKMYLHRIGRTGRAGAAGVAITLAVWNELARLNMIKKALQIEVETHEVFSTSPILDELFDLPAREERQRTPSRRSEGTDEGRGARAKGRESKTRESKTRDAKGRESKSRDAKGRGGRRIKDAKADVPSRDEAAEAPALRTRTRRRSRGDEAPAVSDEATTETTDAPARGRSDRGADSTVEEPTRIRRRSRSSRAENGVNERSTQSATPRAATDEAATDEAASSDVRARTRTRTRSTEERPSGDRLAPTAARSKDRDDAATDAEADRGTTTRTGGARTRTRTRREATGDRAGSASGDRTTARSGRGDAGERGRTSGNGDSSGKSNGKSRGGRGGRAGGRGRARDGGRDSGQPQRGDGGRTRSEPVSSDDARGNGQPRLRRPLEVTHLP